MPIDPARSRVALAVIPALGIAALAMGLRLGARDDFTAAIVSAAPQSAGGSPLAWQLSTLANVRGVEEPVAIAARVEASAQGRTAAAEVVTNEDGIAEFSLDLGPLRLGERVGLRVTDAGGGALAVGETTVLGPARTAPSRQWVAHSRQDGGLAIDVAIRGGRLGAGHAGTGWARVVDLASRAPVSADALTLLPDAGLEAALADSGCRSGYARLSLSPIAHVVSLSIEARRGALAGAWVGALPVAPGAFTVSLADRAPAGPLTFDVIAPGAQSRAYVEVNDDAGRVFATVVPLPPDAARGAQARVTTIALKSGRYWVVVSSDPGGATAMTGATLAWPVEVGGAPSACDGADDAGLVPQGFARWTAADGRIAGRRRVETQRTRGLFFGLGSLGVAGILEALLIVLGARRAQAQLARLATAAEAPLLRPSRRLGAIDVVVTLLLLALALGLLATFSLTRFG